MKDREEIQKEPGEGRLFYIARKLTHFSQFVNPTYMRQCYWGIHRDLFTPYGKNPTHLFSGEQIKEVKDYFLARRDGQVKAITPFSLSCKKSHSSQERLMGDISVFAEYSPNVRESYDYWENRAKFISLIKEIPKDSLEQLERFCSQIGYIDLSFLMADEHLMEQNRK